MSNSIRNAFTTTDIRMTVKCSLYVLIKLLNLQKLRSTHKPCSNKQTFAGEKKKKKKIRRRRMNQATRSVCQSVRMCNEIYGRGKNKRQINRQVPSFGHKFITLKKTACIGYAWFLIGPVKTLHYIQF